MAKVKDITDAVLDVVSDALMDGAFGRSVKRYARASAVDWVVDDNGSRRVYGTVEVDDKFYEFDVSIEAHEVRPRKLPGRG